MDKSWYLQQGDKVLNSGGYAALTTTEATDLIKRDWSMLLKGKNSRPERITKFITQVPPNKHTIPVLYLMPKLHKNPVGIRPIVAGHSYCFTASAVVLDHKLRKSYEDSRIILRDSKTLINVLENTKVTDKSVILATADISNLYGEIPLGELFILCVELCDRKERNWMTPLLHHVLFCNIVQFNSKLYKQTTGVAMGSPFGPTAANVFLHHKVDNHLINKNEFPEIEFVARYLDDVLFILAADTNITEFQQKLNSIHAAMKFTLDASPTNVDFLDITIYKGNRFQSSGVLDLKTFSKPMNKFLYIPYLSLHTTKTLKGFIKTEFMRLLRNSSNERVFLRSALEFVHNLRARGYPCHFIRNVWLNINYNQRHLVLRDIPPKEKATPTQSDDQPLIYVSHLDRHTRTGLWRDIVKNRLREIKKAQMSSSVTQLLTQQPRLIMALRKSPTLYNVMVFNKPSITNSTDTPATLQ